MNVSLYIMECRCFETILHEFLVVILSGEGTTLKNRFSRTCEVTQTQESRRTADIGTLDHLPLVSLLSIFLVRKKIFIAIGASDKNALQYLFRAREFLAEIPPRLGWLCFSCYRYC